MKNRVSYWFGILLLVVILPVYTTATSADAGSWLTQGTAKQAEKTFRKARSAYGSADYAKVVKLVDEIVKENPKFAKAYALRGKAHKDMGDVDKAFSDLNRAIKLDPGLGEAWFIRGQVNEIMGEIDKATSDYANACKNGYKSAC